MGGAIDEAGKQKEKERTLAVGPKRTKVEVEVRPPPGASPVRDSMRKASTSSPDLLIATNSRPEFNPPPLSSSVASITMAANSLYNIYRLAVPATIGFSLLGSSIYDVRGGTRAIIFDRLSGVQDKVMSEGTHFLIPWLQRAIIYDVRTKPRNISTTTGSKDLQMVSLTLRVLHRPDVPKLPAIYQV